MGTAELSGPFDPSRKRRIIFAKPPLTSVVVQVRHQDLARLSGDVGETTAQTLAADLADTYPVFNRQKESQLAIVDGELRPASTATQSWRLSQEDQRWIVTFSAGFVALQTSHYEGREDFRRRVAEVIEKYAVATKSPFLTRIGVRYINRLVGEDLTAIGELLRPEMLGPLCAELPHGVSLQYMINQALYTSSQGSLHVRWGKLPPRASMDTAVTPIEDESWILDIDSFETPSGARITVETVDQMLTRLADTAYTFFLWSITPAFIKRFGGTG